MKRAFTLIELLVVIGIMALMGTAAVGGYRAMQRGMADRGAMENVNAFIRAAYQRAQVDRLPTAVYFWNETLTTEDGSNNTLRVVGKAVAIRRHGRITQVDGNYLYDEFADLNQTYASEEDSGSSGGSANNSMYLYPMDNPSDLQSSSTLPRSTVRSLVVEKELSLMYLSSADGGLPTQAECDDDIQGQTGSGDSADALVTYAFEMVQNGNVRWKQGMAYGFEFAQIQLPVGYIFGSAYSKSASSPIQAAGTLVFLPGENAGNGSQNSGTVVGRNNITVCALRPDENGNLAAKLVSQSANPDSERNFND
jgi:prepilin-type N-terminal cleavage/methylation domain-containing protein